MTDPVRRPEAAALARQIRKKQPHLTAARCAELAKAQLTERRPP